MRWHTVSSLPRATWRRPFFTTSCGLNKAIVILSAPSVVLSAAKNLPRVARQHSTHPIQTLRLRSEPSSIPVIAGLARLRKGLRPAYATRFTQANPVRTSQAICRRLRRNRGGNVQPPSDGPKGRVHLVEAANDAERQARGPPAASATPVVGPTPPCRRPAPASLGTASPSPKSESATRHSSRPVTALGCPSGHGCGQLSPPQAHVRRGRWPPRGHLQRWSIPGNPARSPAPSRRHLQSLSDRQASVQPQFLLMHNTHVTWRAGA